MCYITTCDFTPDWSDRTMSVHADACYSPSFTIALYPKINTMKMLQVYSCCTVLLTHWFVCSLLFISWRWWEHYCLVQLLGGLLHFTWMWEKELSCWANVCIFSWPLNIPCHLIHHPTFHTRGILFSWKYNTFNNVILVFFFHCIYFCHPITLPWQAPHWISALPGHKKPHWDM